MIKEFREFILRGNLVDLAVAVVIGTAFTALVNSMVKDLITPLIAAVFGGKHDFSNLAFTINGSRFLYGDFINALITFVIVAAVMFFLVVKPVNALMARCRPEPASIRRRASARSACRTSRRLRAAARSVRQPLAPLADLLRLAQDAVDQAVLDRLLGGEEAVALHVLVDLLDRLAGVLRVDLVEPRAQGERLLGVDRDVGGLALEAARDLVDQDAAVRQREALAGRAAGQQQRAHRHRDPDAGRLDLRLDELHRVVDREAGVDLAAGRVDVDRDVLVRVVGLEVDQLRDDEVRDLVVDRRADEDDALAQQARVDVERALAARVLLDHHRDHRHRSVLLVFVATQPVEGSRAG